LVAWLYRRLRQREGLGLGDAKFSAAIGAWVGWQGLPTMLLWGSMLGLLFAIALTLRGMRLRLSDRLPFGVFLAAGGWLVWLMVRSHSQAVEGANDRVWQVRQRVQQGGKDPPMFCLTIGFYFAPETRLGSRSST
jgi:leader peptidase (prepilin peptidase)/N-methyltransferase